MLSEAVKRHLLSNRDYFYVKRWEGKPWSFKFKYALANYPEIVLASVFVFALMPAVVAYKFYTYPNSYYEAMRKYNYFFTVVRDDDPNVERIKRQKEMGREHFPKL